MGQHVISLAFFDGTAIFRRRVADELGNNQSLSVLFTIHPSLIVVT
jgi:hypothetical protein